MWILFPSGYGITEVEPSVLLSEFLTKLRDPVVFCDCKCTSTMALWVWHDQRIVHAVIDPPVTPEERLADAMAAFGLVCDRAIEALDQLRCELDFRGRKTWREPPGLWQDG